MEEVSFPKRSLFRFEWRGGVFLISLTLISCILVALLTGAGLIPEQNYPQAQSIVLTSSLDPATYRTIQLDNGLQVTLISDRNATRASAGIVAPIGWASDPYYFPGRAEYLQQALLRGSLNYPSPQAFSKVLAFGAGSQLGETGEKYTAISFEIDDKDFTMALKQFADALIAPNLYPNDGITLSTNHLTELAEVLISANSTFRQPADLKNVAVRTEILGLFQRHYLPDRMWAVVGGNFDLDSLEATARTLLAVLQSPVNSTSESSPNAFSRSYLNQIAYVATNPGGERLELHFVIDDSSFGAQSSPSKYLEYIFGYSGVNSTFEALSARGVATSWQTRVKDYGDYLDLAIFVGLTPYGVQRWEECAAAVYEFVAVLGNNATQVEQSWTAYKTAAANLKRYAYFPSLGEKVQSFLRNVLEFGPRHAFNGKDVLYTYDSNTVIHALQNIEPKRSLVVLFSSESFAKSQGNLQELAGFEFKLELMKSHIWAQAGKLMVPTALLYDGGSLGVYRCDLLCKARNKRLNLVSASSFHTLWFRRQPDLPIPRVFFGLNILLPRAGEDIRRAALVGVLRSFVLNKAYPQLAPALQTGANFEIFTWPTGLVLRMLAWFEGFETLAHAIFTSLKGASTMTAADFELSRLGAINYFLTMNEDPSQNIADSLLFKNLWASRDLAEAATSLTYDDMLAFCSSTLAMPFLELVVSGSYPQDRANKFFGELVANYTLGLTPLASADVSLPALAALDGFYVYRDTSRSNKYSLTVSFTWQRFSVEVLAAAELLADLIQTDGPLNFTDYDNVKKLNSDFQARTGMKPTVSAEHKWGYTFFTLSLSTSNQAVYSQGVLSAVQSYFASLGASLASLPSSVFPHNATDFTFRSLLERGDEEMMEILSHFYYFTRRTEVQAAKQKMTKARFLELYNQSMNAQKALVVELFPAATEIPLELPKGMSKAGAVLQVKFYAAEPTIFQLITKA